MGRVNVNTYRTLKWTQSGRLVEHTSSIESMILDNWTSFRSFRVRDL